MAVDVKTHLPIGLGWPIGAVVAALLGVVTLADSGVKESRVRERHDWRKYSASNCWVDAKATHVTFEYGADPRPDSKLTIYKCNDGQTFATTRAYESQLQLDEIGGGDVVETDDNL